MPAFAGMTNYDTVSSGRGRALNHVRFRTAMHPMWCMGERRLKWMVLKFREIITPTLPSPIKGEEKEEGRPGETRYEIITSKRLSG